MAGERLVCGVAIIFPDEVGQRAAAQLSGAAEATSA